MGLNKPLRLTGKFKVTVRDLVTEKLANLGAASGNLDQISAVKEAGVRDTQEHTVTVHGQTAPAPVCIGI